MATWLKVNCLLSSTAAFWLAAFSPLPPVGKGISYSLALAGAVQLVRETEELMIQSKRRIALKVMNQELEDVEIALHTIKEEAALHEVYGVVTYPPEVKEELTQSLEHLYSEPDAEHPEELTTSPSQKKALYLAIKSLLEAKGKTHVIEKVLRVRWAKGEEMLQQILDEGETNGW